MPQIAISVPDDVLHQIDQWRAGMPVPPSRSSAVAALISEALQARGLVPPLVLADRRE